MKKVYLCGHTGSFNRGCEAIVRSTSKILKRCGLKNIFAFTFDYNADVKLGINTDVELVPYKKRNIISRAFSYLEFKIFKSKEMSSKTFYKNLYKKEKEFITLNIGGDIYCCSTPYISYALNDLSKQYNIPNIFWGCSVDEKILNDERMKQDLNDYDYIITRESLTEDILKQVVTNKSKIYRACDPAFQLPIKKTDLPINFLKGNTVGINLSGYVFNNEYDEKDIIYKNIYMLIDYIITETDMNVCLIPHVYTTVGDSHDYIVLSKIYDKYNNSARVSIVNQELSCTEIKYIISNCRFFIGARTHATIAAYSTAVPTIALSYSIKSLGIAKDLFGDNAGHVIRWQDIKEENVLKNAFIDTLLNNEKSIKERYERILPEYKESILTVAKEVLNKVGV